MGIYNLSFKNLRRRKLRSLLTMLGIIIGVTSLVLLVGSATGMTNSIVTSSQSPMGDIIITSAGYGTQASGGEVPPILTPAIVSKIKSVPQLNNFREYDTFKAELNGKPIMVKGITDWSHIHLETGTQGVVIDQNIVNEFGYKVGSNVNINGRQMQVTGILSVKLGGLVYLNLDKALPMTDNKISTISAVTNSDPNTLSKQIKNQTPEVDALTQSDIQAQSGSSVNDILVFTAGIASIGLIVGIISIVNTMLISVIERTKEIGILKAIGFTNKEIMGSVLVESGLLGFIGSIIGLIIGTLGILYLTQHFATSQNIYTMLPLWLVIGSVGGATILSVLAGLYPAWHATRINVVEALRSE